MKLFLLAFSMLFIVSPTLLQAQKRPRVMSKEKRINSKDQRKIDFEETSILGTRKTPMGTLINQNKAEKGYDFVKIRHNWKREMIQSAKSLSAH